jgi:hypothetical protein
MTNEERSEIADRMFALVFSLRPDDGEKGQAWALSAMTRAMARTILASVGPNGQAAILLLKEVQEEVLTLIERAQTRSIREKLTRPT